MKKYLATLFARNRIRKSDRAVNDPIAAQERILASLVRNGRRTSFGRQHDFDSIDGYRDFKARAPLCTYEDLRPFIERIAAGERNVLWPGRPAYFAKTSGTTSGTKYIPLTRRGLAAQVRATRDMLLRYIRATGRVDFVGGKMIFLQGSPVLENRNGILTGRLSGIVAHCVPFYLRANRKPSYRANCIEDWERKVETIVDETIGADMTLLSGIPSWLQMYFERLVARSGKPVGELFPHFSLMVTGGVNYQPYRARFEQLIGREVAVLETYPASEGFIAASDSVATDGSLLLNVDGGLFYEFVPADRYGQPDAPRLSLGQVETGVNYALVISSESGLWGYCIGDTVVFTSTKPYRVKVSGRVAHYTSAFGEHVIAIEAERAVQRAAEETGALVSEFTLAPQVAPPEGGLPYHEWWVEFARTPEDAEAFARSLDRQMQRQNIYYRDLIEGHILRPAVVRALPPGAFAAYMKSQGKLGGQNKIQRLSNDRRLADALRMFSKTGSESLF